MKKILLVSAVALGLSSVAFASGVPMPAPCGPDFTPGIYVGLQGGYADTGWDALDIEHVFFIGALNHHIEISDNDGIAGRVFIGYDFHKYLALEAGYFLVNPKAEIKYAGHVYSDIRTQAFDLVLKGKLPIMDEAGLYAKAGVGYLMTDGRNEHNLVSENTIKDKSDKFDLVYGVGAYYNFAHNWTVDVSYTRYNSGHEKLDNEWQPVVDFYALGLSYKFDLPV